MRRKPLAVPPQAGERILWVADERLAVALFCQANWAVGCAGLIVRMRDHGKRIVGRCLTGSLDVGTDQFIDEVDLPDE